MGNVFSSSRSRQNERDIEELRQQFRVLSINTDNNTDRLNRYEQIINNHERIISNQERLINYLIERDSDRTNNRSRRREEAEDENPAPFPDRERGHHHDGDLVR